MNGAANGPSLRRYLLGEATEDESAAVEREYFEADAAAERVAAVEDDLIEEYLDERLPASDRERFERYYLASPAHRHRLDLVRRLAAAANQPRASRIAPVFRYRWLAAAAVLLLAIGGSYVWRQSRPAEQVARVRQQRAEPATRPLAFAVPLPLVAVRGADAAPTVILPTDVRVVALQLEADPSGPAVRNGRVVVRAVTGQVVWEGSVSDAALPAGVAAQVDVPAARLPPDDYIVALFTRPGGVEEELNRYVLRIRER